MRPLSITQNAKMPSAKIERCIMLPIELFQHPCAARAKLMPPCFAEGVLTGKCLKPNRLCETLADRMETIPANFL
jgi:hypothetical protein